MPQEIERENEDQLEMLKGVDPSPKYAIKSMNRKMGLNSSIDEIESEQ